MTLNGLELTKYYNNYFILFLLICLHNFLIFKFLLLSFRIIFERTCYDTTVIEVVRVNKYKEYEVFNKHQPWSHMVVLNGFMHIR